MQCYHHLTNLQSYVSSLCSFELPFSNCTVMSELISWRHDCALRTRREQI